MPLHEFEVKDESISEALYTLQQSGKEMYISSNSVRSEGLTLRYSHHGIAQKIELLSTREKKPYNGG